MQKSEAKRTWFVNIQQIYEGYFYVAARTPETARRLAWVHLTRHNETRGSSTHPGYLVDAFPETNLVRVLAEGGVDVDEDDPTYADVDEVPEIF